jgi:uncharacterized protein YqeY
MTLNEKIKADLKESMIAKDETRLLVLRGITAEIQKELLAKKSSASAPTDEEAVAVVKRLAKQRKDSIEQFTKGNRPDLAKNEARELLILEGYLPKTMSRDDIAKIAKAKQKELGITDKAKSGMLIGAISKELKGKADGADIKAVVDGLFA